MARKKIPLPKPICGTCGKSFDGVEAAKAARAGRAFIHECGRVLVRERSGGNAEVPTHSHVYEPNDLSNSRPSSDTPPGDA